MAANCSELLTGSFGHGTLSDDRPLPGRENPPTASRQSIFEGDSRIGALSGLMTFSWAMTAIGNASFLGDFPPGSAPPSKPASRNFLIQDSVEGLLAKTAPTHPCPKRP
jgi:hypothetical protein